MKSNSSSHKKEWDRFTRLLENSKKCPFLLAEESAKDKTSTFALWMDMKCDTDAAPLHCIIELARSQPFRTSVVSGLCFVFWPGEWRFR